MSHDSAVISGKAAAGFTAPALIIIALFLLFPALWVIGIGLTDLTVTSIAPASFVGLKNFSRILGDHFFWNALKVSLIFTLGSAVVGQAVLGLSLSVVLLDESPRVRSWVTAAAVAAWILPEVVVAYCWAAYLDGDAGLVNRILALAGLPAMDWLMDHALFSIIVFNTWRGTAFSLLLFNAALASIPPAQLETAQVLGAGTWQKFRDVIAPMIHGTILTDLILITLWTFNVFTPYLLTRGGPSFTTELLPVFIYRNAFLRTLNLGYGSAAATVMLLVNLALGTVYLWSGRKR